MAQMYEKIWTLTSDVPDNAKQAEPSLPFTESDEPVPY